MSYRQSGKKSLAVLLDPDKLLDREGLDRTMQLINSSPVDYIFIGGSLVTESGFDERVKHVKDNTSIPVILFPGSVSQITPNVDAVLFLSLISGRNADLLIGQHVVAAPTIKRHKLETISTGYMLVDCGKPTTASYISATPPIPHDKPEIAAATACAGEMLGLSTMYLDGGSGAAQPVSEQMIQAVSRSTECPLIVGGGIRSTEQAHKAWSGGADIIVIGTAFEENPDLLFDICAEKARMS